MGDSIAESIMNMNNSNNSSQANNNIGRIDSLTRENKTAINQLQSQNVTITTVSYTHLTLPTTPYV